MDRFDICVAGAGVVGLAIAYQISSSPAYANASIVLLEKEKSFGQITSSRNSEVIHAGIYYATDSLKAKLCAAGKELLYEHLQKFNLPYNKLGKLIVAQTEEEDALRTVNDKALENGVDDLTLLDRQQLKKLEPSVQGNVALFSPSTGIIDCHAYMQNLLHLAEANGVIFATRTEVDSVKQEQNSFLVNALLTHGMNSESYIFSCNQFVNCAGLGAQKLAANIEGVKPETIPRLYMCKGDYFSFIGSSPFKHLIYPMPEPNHAGLGIHATLDIAGQLRFGPDTCYVDSLDYSIDLAKSEQFAAAIKQYYPAITSQKLQPAYSGIRPKIVGPEESAGDFNIQDSKVHGVNNLIQLFGMESPALTASLAIGNYVVSLLEQ